MNERIQQLADEAQYYAEYTTPQGVEWFGTFKEKFAELIVRECAEVARSNTRVDSKVYLMIEQHFGVEE